MEGEYVQEVPSSLKQLARLIARGFYSIDDALIIDMLVRNPCMKEDDMCDLLKFERKMLRARLSFLQKDKFIQSKLKMETVDNKSQKVTYYYINYKSFVNTVKYKLDQMRKKMETKERDTTSRASFKCPNCKKSFTDLEADQLYDPFADEFRCFICRSPVEEDQSAGQRKDSRLLMARFNEQMEPFYRLLRDIEDVKLAPSLLEPEPTDISHLQRDAEGRARIKAGGEQWSGESSRSGGLQVEDARVDVSIGDSAAVQAAESRKEVPIWMMQSTVIAQETSESVPEAPGTLPVEQVAVTVQRSEKRDQDITSMLLVHEKSKTLQIESEELAKAEATATVAEGVELLASEEEEEEPMVTIGDEEFPLTEVIGNPKLMAKMTTAEKDAFVQLYQEYYPNE